MSEFGSYASFGQLRSQARQLESQTESLFLQYSAFSQHPPAEPTSEETRVVKDLDAILTQREEILASLTRLLDSEQLASATKLQHLQRHKEILVEHQREFSRLTSVINHERQRANLLTSVHNDIDSFSRNTNSSSSAPVDPRREAEYMLNERSRIERSDNLVDGILSQAYATREEFGRQRQVLANVQRRVTSTASRIPGINTVISKINTRKKRDSLIIATLISLCILVLFFLR
ncbi:snare region anchored in the vesicle membrane C-terminus-domain-containing protein [Kockiozyma suomiensis]|uniref:snare region anchored in the vesicle membrane C-terminus-domain-containing protein n=1 Tax=Kockiozyma suomiensis TaxID=1337062 RepID=UPI003342FDEA